MTFRTLVLAGGIAVAVLTAGCATSVGGQAELAAGAVVSSSSTAAAAGSSSRGSAARTTTGQTPAGQTTSADTRKTTTQQTSSSKTSTVRTTRTPTSESNKSDPSYPSSIPGLSADCNRVLAGISAFSAILSGDPASGTDASISRSTVDKALQQLPASGLPSRAQTDVNILRSSLSSATGKTVTEFALTMADGKVLGALEDLSTWMSTNCT